MLYKTATLAFCAQTMAYSPAMPSKLASSRVARVGDIEMAKKSVRILQSHEARLCTGCCRLTRPRALLIDWLIFGA